MRYDEWRRLTAGMPGSWRMIIVAALMAEWRRRNGKG